MRLKSPDPSQIPFTPELGLGKWIEKEKSQRNSAGRRSRTRSIDNFNRYAKHVPRAALAEDVARFRGIGLELVSQPHDLSVDRTVVDVVVVQAGHVEELVARKDAMRRAEEHNEEAELAVAEPHRVPIAARQAARVEVQLPTVETVGANALRPALVYFGPAATQHGADPCE